MSLLTWLFGPVKPRETMNELAARVATETVREKLPAIVHKTMEEILNYGPGRPNTSIRFRWAMIQELRRVDKTMTTDRARDLASEAYRELLSLNKIEFGDAGYAWDKDAAIATIHELEIDHWEIRP